MSKRSAGLLLYRRSDTGVEVFLVHPGGPFWARKDSGAWSIPKGEYGEDEEPLQVALREFQEETGFAPHGDLLELGTIKQAGGKLVSAWACGSDFNPAHLVSNQCQLEWPPHSGRHISIPEVDRGEWFLLDEAQKRIFKSQQTFLDRIVQILYPKA